MNKNKVTLVTGLWDIGRGNLSGIWHRPYEFYLEKFKELLLTDNNLFIFGDKKLKQIVYSIRSVSNTEFVEVDNDYFRHLLFFPKVEQIRKNPEWIEQSPWIKESVLGHLDLYLPIVLSKFLFLERAVQETKSNSNFFYWIDGGIRMPHYFYNKELLEFLSTLSNFFFLSTPHYPENEVHGFKYSEMQKILNQFPETKNLIFLSRGGFFGGENNTILALAPIYHAWLMSTLNKNLLGTEESIFTIMTYLYPTLVNRYVFHIDDQSDIARFFTQLQNVITNRDFFQL